MPLFPIALLLGLLCFFASAPNLQASDCLGAKEAPLALIYLHGLETPSGSLSEEEVLNRRVLTRIASELPIRIALPTSTQLCDDKLCWPGRDAEEVKQTYQGLLKISELCWSRPQAFPSRFAILGFSNGGYFAFKLFKTEFDPRLLAILASGSAGQWNAKTDRHHPKASFHLMIGEQELTFKAARALAKNLRVSLPSFKLHTYTGGHRLDHDTLLGLLKPLATDPKP